VFEKGSGGLEIRGTGEGSFVDANDATICRRDDRSGAPLASDVTPQSGMAASACTESREPRRYGERARLDEQSRSSEDGLGGGKPRPFGAFEVGNHKSIAKTKAGINLRARARSQVAIFLSAQGFAESLGRWPTTMRGKGGWPA